MNDTANPQAEAQALPFSRLCHDMRETLLLTFAHGERTRNVACELLELLENASLAHVAQGETGEAPALLVREGATDAVELLAKGLYARAIELIRVSRLVREAATHGQMVFAVAIETLSADVREIGAQRRAPRVERDGVPAGKKPRAIRAKARKTSSGAMEKRRSGRARSRRS